MNFCVQKTIVAPSAWISSLNNLIKQDQKNPRPQPHAKGASTSLFLQMASPSNFRRVWSLFPSPITFPTRDIAGTLMRYVTFFSLFFVIKCSPGKQRSCFLSTVRSNRESGARHHFEICGVWIVESFLLVWPVGKNLN